MLLWGAMASKKVAWRSVFLVVCIVTFLVVWSALLYQFGANAIVDFIGVENGYLIAFLVALFGGMSSISGVTYVTVILTFAAGGLNPLLLAAMSGVGLTVGDSIYFFLGRRAYYTLGTGKISEFVHRIIAWLNRQHRHRIAVGIYLYAGFTPFPNDVLTISLGLARRPYWQVLLPLALGNITLTYIVAFFGQQLPFLN